MSLTRSSLLLQLRGDSAERAWQEFLLVYRPLIDRAVHRTGIPSQDHEDAVQEVLIQLIRVLPMFSYQKQRGFFRHWLRRITTNKAIDFHRRRARHPVLTDQIDVVPAPEESECWVREFRVSLLKSAMASIKREVRPRTWECFRLHGIEQLPAQETALRLNLSVNAVYVNTSRVMVRLRQFCEFHGENFNEQSNLFSKLHLV